MDPTTIEWMQAHVRDIYRAATGDELPPPPESPPESAFPTAVAFDDLVRRFVDLELAARQIPAVAERVPPLVFTPPIDVIVEDGEVVIEVGVPGIDVTDLDVQCHGESITISGVRGGEHIANRTFLHAELPRGPFQRSLTLALPVRPEPTIDVEHGWIRISLPRRESSDRPRETKSSPSPSPRTPPPTTTPRMEQDNGSPRS